MLKSCSRSSLVCKTHFIKRLFDETNCPWAMLSINRNPSAAIILRNSPGIYKSSFWAGKWNKFAKNDKLSQISLPTKNVQPGIGNSQYLSTAKIFTAYWLEWISSTYYVFALEKHLWFSFLNSFFSVFLASILPFRIFHFYRTPVQ